MKLVIASSNRGKLAEFSDLLGDGNFTFHAQSEFGVTDAEETGSTFIENALIKARHAARVTGLPALGDDSGLCVDALDGGPGLYSARYSGSHGDADANIDKLLRTLDGIPEMQRGAHFYCVLVLLRHADDAQAVVAEGVWHGRILTARRGTGGFGYDPVFFSPEHGCSAAELEPTLKNRVSHRGLALAAMHDRLKAALMRKPCSS